MMPLNQTMRYKTSAEKPPQAVFGGCPTTCMQNLGQGMIAPTSSWSWDAAAGSIQAAKHQGQLDGWLV